MRSRILITASVLSIAALALTFSDRIAQAFTASSTNYFVRQDVLNTGGGSPTYTYSTSTSFKSFGATGETAIGTSTSASFGLRAGFLPNMVISPAPVYEQIHYHWRNDNGSESGATSGTSGNQDTATSSIGVGDLKRLRVEVANHGGTLLSYATQRFGLEYAVMSGSCAATPSTAWNNIGKVGDTAPAWITYNSANMTDGGNTTNIAMSTGGVYDHNHTFLTPNGGQVENSSTTTSPILLSSDSFIEIEYALTPTSAAQSATYCFRTANASSTTNFTYTQYPQATVAVVGSLTFIIDSTSENFPTLTPGNLVATSSLLYVTTTNASGFNVTANRNNAGATLLLNADNTVTIPDKTAWVPGASCGVSGNGTASTTNEASLEFRVMKNPTDTSNYCSAWWGTADTTAAALFAGFPSSAQKIVDRSSASSPQTITKVLYNLDVSTIQRTGAYSGGITYTVTTNP